jgi:hypothetical protein
MVPGLGAVGEGVVGAGEASVGAGLLFAIGDVDGDGEGFGVVVVGLLSTVGCQQIVREDPDRIRPCRILGRACDPVLGDGLSWS